MYLPDNLFENLNVLMRAEKGIDVKSWKPEQNLKKKTKFKNPNRRSNFIPYDTPS